MGNRVILYSLRGFEVFLKVPEIIIIRFGENNELGTIYISYILILGVGRGSTWFTLHLFVYYS